MAGVSEEIRWVWTKNITGEEWTRKGEIEDSGRKQTGRGGETKATGEAEDTGGVRTETEVEWVGEEREGTDGEREGKKGEGISGDDETNAVATGEVQVDWIIDGGYGKITERNRGTKESYASTARETGEREEGTGWEIIITIEVRLKQ